MRSSLAAAVWFVAAFALPQGLPARSERLLDVLRSQDLAAAKRLVSDHPDFGMAHRAVIGLYLSRDDLEAARAYFDDQAESAITHFALAQIEVHSGNLDSAIGELEAGIAIDPSFAEPYGLKYGLVGVYEAKQDLETAVGYFDSLASSDPTNANAFSGLGWSHARRFEFDEAIAAFDRALVLDPDSVHAHHGLVQSYYRTGRYQKSWESSHDLSEAAERRADFESLAYARMMKGNVAFSRGDYRTALEHLQASRTLAQEIGDDGRVASTVNNSAAVYASAGDHDKALEYFELSLELARASGSAQAALNALGNVGTSHTKAGHYDEAIEFYHEALEVARESGFKNQECITLANMGEALELRGDVTEAARMYTEALSIASATENRTVGAFASGALGGLNRDRGRYAEALTLFETELAIGDETGEVEAVWEALAGLGSTYREMGDDDAAIERFREAIARYDAVRESLAIETLGNGFLEDKYEPYSAVVQLLASRGALEDAFTYAEKFKAKGFLDILARGRTLFETQLPESIRVELDEVRARLREAHAERSRAPSATLKLEERVTELELRKSSLLDRVRADHPEFYELATAEPVGASQVQSHLEPHQVLIEYLVGEDRLSIFVITPDALHYREVPLSRETLRRRLADLSPIFDNPSGARLFNAELADFSLPPAEVLYDTLLAPIEEWVAEGSELVVVPDDLLFYLPFETLVAESTDARHRYDFEAATFVLERHAVSYSPSASLLVPPPRRARAEARGVLAFGNPRSREEPQLPNAEMEVGAIGRAFAGLDNEILVGEAATEAAFHDQAEPFRVLHFATHFTADDRQPLYSRIPLANDDALETYEIFDARLNAELAVLSACNTGLGRLRKGEGLIGIRRAFRYAGVPSLVMSLWSVDDEATARIMESFYRRLRSGASKTAALREAKLEYLRSASEEKKDPFFWAPFILSGDGRPMSLPPLNESSGRLWILAALVLIPVAAGTLLARALRRDKVVADRTARSR